MKYIKPLLFVTTLFLFMLIPAARAFSRVPFVTGLKGPTKIITAGQYNLLVAEPAAVRAPVCRGRAHEYTSLWRIPSRNLFYRLPVCVGTVRHSPIRCRDLAEYGLSWRLNVDDGCPAGDHAAKSEHVLHPGIHDEYACAAGAPGTAEA